MNGVLEEGLCGGCHHVKVRNFPGATIDDLNHCIIPLLQKKPTISLIIFWAFLMFYQIFLSQQVKRWAIITYKHGIYELPHELPNNLRLTILGN